MPGNDSDPSEAKRSRFGPCHLIRISIGDTIPNSLGSYIWCPRNSGKLRMVSPELCVPGTLCPRNSSSG